MSGMELWWLGQSGFRLRDPTGGPFVFIDPFLSEHEDRAYPAPLAPERLAYADVILCTHEHIDHFDQPSLKRANETRGANFKLVVPEPIVDQALALGIPRERVIGAQPDQPLQIVGVRIHPVPARHGIHMADAYSFGEAESNGRVRFLGYVVQLGGVRAYHAGDTIPYDGMVEKLRALQPSVALLPMNGRDYFRETERDIVGNMQPREAARLAHDIGARVLVPMHWDIFKFNRGYPRDLVAIATEDYPELTVLVPGRSGKFTITPRDE